MVTRSGVAFAAFGLALLVLPGSVLLVNAPAAAGAGGLGGAGTSITFEAGAIVQQPGQSAEQLANLVISKIQGRMTARGF